MKGRLTNQERQFCRLGAYNIEEFSHNLRENIKGHGLSLVRFEGKFYHIVPPDIYLKCPEAYDNERYFNRVKDILSMRGISLLVRSSTFNNPTNTDSYLWCSV